MNGGSQPEVPFLMLVSMLGASDPKAHPAPDPEPTNTLEEGNQRAQGEAAGRKVHRLQREGGLHRLAAGRGKKSVPKDS